MSDGDVALLSKAVDISQLDPEIVRNNLFPKKVSHEKWLESVEEFFNLDDNYTLVVTSDNDMEKIEELLGVEKGHFSTPYAIKTKVEFCPNCNRQNNFLDVVTTGLRVHSSKFLLDVFTGKHGYIINNTPHQRCMCYGCGNVLPKDATKYSAPIPPSKVDKLRSKAYNVSQYTYPVYTYKF